MVALYADLDGIAKRRYTNDLDVRAFDDTHLLEALVDRSFAVKCRNGTGITGFELAEEVHVLPACGRDTSDRIVRRSPCGQD